MAGVLPSSGEDAGVEFSGVFYGVLREDMIDTVRKVKKPFIDVVIKSVFFEDGNYPLTYVPVFNMVLPLKKDTGVWVRFSGDGVRFPVLWKIDGDMDAGFRYDEKYDLPSGGDLVEFPDAEETTEAVRFSDDFWFIAAKSYAVFHYGDQVSLVSGDGVVVGVTNYRVLASGKVVVEVSGGGEFVVQNSVTNLGKVLNELCTDLMEMQTVGAPALHTVHPATMVKIKKSQFLFEKLLGKG
jgi:hypothetical protein